MHPIIRWQTGHFDLFHPEAVSSSVHLRWGEGEAYINFHFSPDERDEIEDLPWPQQVTEILDRVDARNSWVVPDDRPRRAALREWIAVDENHDAFHEAWEQTALRRIVNVATSSGVPMARVIAALERVA